jgi:hypothetical protein
MFLPIPLIIELDEEEIMLAPQRRDRVLSIHLEIQVSSVQRLLTVIDDEFPMLISFFLSSPKLAWHCPQRLKHHFHATWYCIALPYPPSNMLLECSWRHSRLAFAALFLTVISRGHCCTSRSTSASHSLTSTGFPFESRVSVHT